MIFEDYLHWLKHLPPAPRRKLNKCSAKSAMVAVAAVPVAVAVASSKTTAESKKNILTD